MGSKRIKEESAVLDAAKAILDSFGPHERRGDAGARPIRQMNFSITEEEHVNLSTNARNAGVTTRALILRALKPFTERVIR